MVDMQRNDSEKQTNPKIFNGAAKTMFPAKNSYQNPKFTHNEEIKTFNSRMFLCALNEKERLTGQSIQNLVIWCTISIAK